MKTSLLSSACVFVALFTGLVRSAEAGPISYTYDSAGRLTKADYGQGRTINYTYSSRGDLLQRQMTGLSTNVPRGTLILISNAEGADGRSRICSKKPSVVPARCSGEGDLTPPSGRWGRLSAYLGWVSPRRFAIRIAHWWEGKPGKTGG